MSIGGPVQGAASRILSIIFNDIAQIKKEDKIIVIIDSSTQFIPDELGSIIDKYNKKIVNVSPNRMISYEDLAGMGAIFIFAYDNFCFSDNITNDLLRNIYIHSERKKFRCHSTIYTGRICNT